MMHLININDYKGFLKIFQCFIFKELCSFWKYSKRIKIGINKCCKLIWNGNVFFKAKHNMIREEQSLINSKILSILRISLIGLTLKKQVSSTVVEIC